jgi:GNAT superfamily N-acetyltransferase
VASLGETRGTLLVAEAGARAEGLLFMEPEIWGSAYLNQRIWSVRHLVVAPDAPARTAEILVDTALGFLEAPVDLLVAEVPATDGAVLRGLHHGGFRVVGCEAIGIVAPPGDNGYIPPGVSIAPLRREHLPDAAVIAKTCCTYNGYSIDSGFDSSRLERLYGYLLGLRVDDPDGGAIVAEDDAGEVLGFACYRRETELESYTPLRLAGLDLLGVRPDRQSNGLGEILHRQALSRLKAERVQAVTTRITASRPARWNSPAILRRIGYKIASSNLILHKRPERDRFPLYRIGLFEDSNQGLPDWRTGTTG